MSTVRDMEERLLEGSEKEYEERERTESEGVTELKYKDQNLEGNWC